MALSQAGGRKNEKYVLSREEARENLASSILVVAYGSHRLCCFVFLSPPPPPRHPEGLNVLPCTRVPIFLAVSLPSSSLLLSRPPLSSVVFPDQRPTACVAEVCRRPTGLTGGCPLMPPARTPERTPQSITFATSRENNCDACKSLHQHSPTKPAVVA